ncbi:NUDIX hydrolase [Metabacillus sp. GX 13764]|uniref:NUDIX hydrolase n=1 Tax=Metabacillus kandeliae TaxID=2900151 RepID=UPI001E3F43F6|nr:NUDIX hydrolase [Metabacillus kandeliae]MCD7033959.1 NUDIX hydrolase [Metabacillus kandeliae]
MSLKWLEWAKEIQALSQAGLAYSKDVFDLERFERLREISIEIMEEYTEIDYQKIKTLFASETGYQTPKIDVRCAVFQDRKILLVKETADGKWSLPGGFGDIGLSPAEVAVKELREETGYEGEVLRLIGVMDKKNHPHPPSPSHIYKLFFLCRITGGKAEASIETEDVQFFPKNDLPPLSIGRITEGQIHLMFDYLDNPDKPALFE